MASIRRLLHPVPFRTMKSAWPRSLWSPSQLRSRGSLTGIRRSTSVRWWAAIDNDDRCSPVVGQFLQIDGWPRTSESLDRAAQPELEWPETRVLPELERRTTAVGPLAPARSWSGPSSRLPRISSMDRSWASIRWSWRRTDPDGVDGHRPRVLACLPASGRSLDIPFDRSVGWCYRSCSHPRRTLEVNNRTEHNIFHTWSWYQPGTRTSVTVA